MAQRGRAHLGEVQGTHSQAAPCHAAGHILTLWRDAQGSHRALYRLPQRSICVDDHDVAADAQHDLQNAAQSTSWDRKWLSFARLCKVSAGYSTGIRP